MSTLEGCRILLVEDDAMIALAVETMLQESGCAVIGPLASLQAATAALAEQQPDCAVLDIGLGAESVFPLADALADAQVPFIFLSGHSAPIVPERHAGRPFVGKPFGERVLLAALTTALGEAADSRALVFPRRAG
jgi:DNA-binding response OmpR family regulator